LHLFVAVQEFFLFGLAGILQFDKSTKGKKVRPKWEECFSFFYLTGNKLDQLL
jgi:hypothetical protein